MINDLTVGSITKNLIKVSFPVMGASLFQMAYQIIDMYWVGKIGSDLVAAVGTAGFYISIFFALGSLSFIGVGIKISQAIGEKNEKKALEYAIASILLIILISSVITISVLTTKNYLIGIFNLPKNIFISTISYLTIAVTFSVFKNLGMTFNRIFIGYGSGRIPFIVGTISLVLNIILDPILIFKYNMGIEGAAWATVISQVLGGILYIIIFISQTKYNFTQGIQLKFSYIRNILKLSYPVAFQRLAFTSIAIIIGKIISEWGPNAITIQKIGVQLESISWITAGGMQAAITSFIGQNFGAKKFHRLKKGYLTSITMLASVGLFVSLIFLIFPIQLFNLFVHEPAVISGGAVYLRILAISQIFMCIDITTMGAFNGIGKTGIPPIINTTITTLRIPLALLLSHFYGLNGVWVAISITTIFKGTILSSLFLRLLKKQIIRNKN